MEQRLNYTKAAPGGYRAMAALNRYVEESGLEPLLLELVKMRASQINGCAYCIDMHSKDARALGESEQRLYALNAWRETPFYSEREVSDAVYEAVRPHFNDEEMVNLTLAIVTINGWNRLAVGFRSEVGSYQSKHKVPA